MGPFPACSRQGWESWSVKDLAMPVPPLLNPRRRWAEPTAEETMKRLDRIWRSHYSQLGWDMTLKSPGPILPSPLSPGLASLVSAMKGTLMVTSQSRRKGSHVSTELPSHVPCRGSHCTDLHWKNHKQLPPLQEGPPGYWLRPRRCPRPAEMRHTAWFSLGSSLGTEVPTHNWRLSPPLCSATLQLCPPPILPEHHELSQCCLRCQSSQTRLLLARCLPLRDRNLVLPCCWHHLGHS